MLPSQENRHPRPPTHLWVGRRIALTFLFLILIVLSLVTDWFDEFTWSKEPSLLHSVNGPPPSAVAGTPPWAQGSRMRRNDSALSRWPQTTIPVKCGPFGGVTPYSFQSVVSNKERLEALADYRFFISHINVTSRKMVSARFLMRGIRIELAAGNCGVEHIDAGVCVRVENDSFPALYFSNDVSVQRRLHGSLEVGMRCFPRFVVAGAMKAGTGSLRTFLSAHPSLQVNTGGFSRAGKEMNFFGSKRKVSEYLRLFPYSQRTSNGSFTFDKSPNYISGEGSFIHMASLAPSMSIILILRNPSDRAFSHFKHDVRHHRWYYLYPDDGQTRVVYSTDPALKDSRCVFKEGVSTLCRQLSDSEATPENFHAAITSRPYLNASTRYDSGSSWSGGIGLSSMVGLGLYAKQLSAGILRGERKDYSNQKQANGRFDRGSVLVLWYEFALKNLLVTLNDIEEFLGLPSFDYNAVTEISPVGHLRLKEHVGTWDRFLESYVAPLLGAIGAAETNILPASICASSGVTCGGHNGPPMRQDTRKMLERYFAAPNTNLLRLLRPKIKLADATPPPQWKFLCSCNMPSEGEFISETKLCSGEHSTQGTLCGDGGQMSDGQDAAAAAGGGIKKW